jgi:molecular chaperone GrpE (heat shock protein)
MSPAPAWKIPPLNNSNFFKREKFRVFFTSGESVAFIANFSETIAMSEANWKIPKWPFLLGNVALLGVAYAVIFHGRPVPHWGIIASACVALGALLGCLPFILDYRATGKLINANTIATAAEPLRDLEKFARQISDATGQWARVQEISQVNAEKTTTAAREIAERMAAEVRDFNEFQKKMSDSERTALRLEVEKFRRGEAEWLQTLVRVLDHVFALHTAALRSGNAQLAEPITHFQNACRGTVRRVGLVTFAAEPGEAFNAERHQLPANEKLFDGAVVGETVASGYTFQGKLLRSALVRLRAANMSAPTITAETFAEEKSADEISLQPPD